MADLLTSLGEKIRMYRKMANLSQEKLAERASVSVYYVGEIERGEASPSLSVIQDLAKVLGVKIMDLFDFPDENNKEIIDEIIKLMKRKEWEGKDLRTIRNLLRMVRKL